MFYVFCISGGKVEKIETSLTTQVEFNDFVLVILVPCDFLSPINTNGFKKHCVLGCFFPLIVKTIAEISL